jgi:hypothetical protein
MTEAEITKLLKTHRVSIAREKLIWKSPEAKKLHDELNALINREIQSVPYYQSPSPYQNHLGPTPENLLESASARIRPLEAARDELIRQHTEPGKMFHIIARPI